MNWQPIAGAAATVIATALLTALGFEVRDRNLPAAVPRDDCAAVVRRMVESQIASESRWRCKYRTAAGEATGRGWDKPRTRRAWDAICAEGEDSP